MADTDMRTKLVEYIRDAVALENNVDQMLSGMISTTEDPAMKRRLEQHKDETRAPRERLEERLGSYGSRARR